MAKIFEEMLKSPAYIFVVGADKTCFTVHSAIIARQSHLLKTLIIGPMAEAVSTTVVLEDVDCNTFVKFCQFAYFGDYDPAVPEETVVQNRTSGTRTLGPKKIGNKRSGPKPDRTKRKVSFQDGERRIYVPYTHIEDDTPPPSACMAPKRAGNTTLGALLSGKEVPCRRTTQYKIVHESKRPIQQPDREEALLKEFKKKAYIPTAPHGPFLVQAEPQAEFPEREDSTLVLLEHAHLYTFADKWDVPALRNLTLSKLHKILASSHKRLANVNTAAATVDAIVALVRYAYDNAHTPDPAGVDQLQELVESFLACHDEVLLRVPKFIELLKEGGSLEDAFSKVRKNDTVESCDEGEDLPGGYYTPSPNYYRECDYEE